MERHPGIFNTRHIAYNLPSLHNIYSIRVTGIVDSLEQSDSSPNGLIFVKATNAATNIKMHISHYKVSARI